MRFTLRQLEVFDAVARHGSVTQAADELHLTQSATSMAIHALEKALGRTLFRREGRSLQLTEQGRALQPRARSMLTSAGELDREVAADSARESLLVGASPTVADHLLGEVLLSFMGMHPRVHVTVAALPSLAVIERMEEMSLDVGLIEMVTARGSLAQQRWFNDRFAIVCAPGHRLTASAALSATDLASESWCLQPRFSDSRRQFTYALLSLLETIDITLESDSISLIKAAVAGGVLLSCLPRPSVARELECGSLAELTVSNLDLKMPFSILTRRGVQLSAAQSDFVACALDRAPATR